MLTLAESKKERYICTVKQQQQTINDSQHETHETNFCNDPCRRNSKK